jgi:hypothetical protein
MFTPYQREPIHGLSSIWTTVNHTLADAELAPSSSITTGDHGPGTDFNDIIQGFADPLSPAAYTDWYPALPINPIVLDLMYQSVLRYEVETLFGTANHAVVAMPGPSVCSTIPFGV